MAPIMLLIGANPMSALPPKAEIRGATRHVCYGPIADIELSQNAGFNFGTLRIGCGRPLLGARVRRSAQVRQMKGQATLRRRAF
jgi:hypothetical protein